MLFCFYICYYILFFVIIKCADGPADVLDFDDEDIGALSKNNRIMYTHDCGWKGA